MPTDHVVYFKSYENIYLIFRLEVTLYKRRFSRLKGFYFVGVKSTAGARLDGTCREVITSLLTSLLNMTQVNKYNILPPNDLTT